MPLYKEIDPFVHLFRYGREDEELMGLRFCNEVVVAAEQIYPTAMEEAMDTKTRSKSGSSVPNVTENSVKTPKVPAVPNSTSLKRRNSALVNNQGFLAVPFVVDMGSAAPPSIRLIPCRPYSGAPIGKPSPQPKIDSFYENVPRLICLLICVYYIPEVSGSSVW